MSTQKTNHPINKVGGVGGGGGFVLEEEMVLADVNRLSKDCRAIPFGIEREQCYLTHVLPLLDQLNGLGYSVEWNIEAEQYKLVESEGGKEWVHPMIRLR